MFTECARREGDSPPGIDKWECAASIQTSSEAMEHSSGPIENIYQPMPPPRNVVLLVRVLLRECHEDHPAHGLNIKGRVSDWCMWVRKLPKQHDIRTV